MVDPNKTADLHVWMPQWVKDLVAAAADAEGVSMSQYCAVQLSRCARDTIGLPKPPDPVAPPPTVADVLKSYVAGETKLIGSCGEAWPCGYSPDKAHWIGDFEFCHLFHVRIS